MKETGISKKEAKDYLRRAGWDYEKAKQLWAISKFQEINFEKIFDELAQAVQKLIAELPGIIQEMTESLAENIRKISEAAAAGASKDEIRDRLGITSEKEGDEK
jgi:HEPN domain-containing protein